MPGFELDSDSGSGSGFGADSDSGSEARVDADRLHRLLGVPELDWLVHRIAARIAAGQPAAEGTATLADPEPAQRRALERLLGRAPGRGRSLTVRLSDVDAVLRDSGVSPEGLTAAVTALRGPIPVRRDVAEASRAAWSSAYAPLADLTARRPELSGWLRHTAAAGRLKQLAADPATAAALAAQAAQVLAVLPHTGIGLPVLAARTTGDAHALDGDRPLAALVLSAVRSLTNLTTADTLDAAGRRSAWAAVGVATDDLSSRVLVLNVPPPPGDRRPLARLLALTAEAGEPAVLTLRMLDSLPERPGNQGPADLSGTVVSVCENPAVLSAAAAELGPACPPLVCLEGTPSVAAIRLLHRLLARGASLRYHGDFDWGGFRIAAAVFDLADRCGTAAAPWRFDSAAYLDAVQRGLGGSLGTSRPRDTPWDPDLRDAVETHGVRVEEEHVIEELLTDLAGGRGINGAPARPVKT